MQPLDLLVHSSAIYNEAYTFAVPGGMWASAGREGVAASVCVIGIQLALKINRSQQYHMHRVHELWIHIYVPIHRRVCLCLALGAALIVEQQSLLGRLCSIALKADCAGISVMRVQLTSVTCPIDRIKPITRKGGEIRPLMHTYQ